MNGAWMSAAHLLRACDASCESARCGIAHWRTPASATLRDPLQHLLQDHSSCHHYRCIAAPLRRRNGFCNCKRLRRDSCGTAIDCGKTVAVPQLIATAPAIDCRTCYGTCNDVCDYII